MAAVGKMDMNVPARAAWLLAEFSFFLLLRHVQGCKEYKPQTNVYYLLEEVIEQLDEITCLRLSTICYSCSGIKRYGFKGPWPVSNRDFVFVEVFLCQHLCFECAAAKDI